jgi:methionine-rich copper-binding protein CopC
VTRSGGTPAETIFVSTTNTEGSTNSGDYTAIADQALAFAAGELTKTVTLTITNDTVVESNETYGLVVQRNTTDPDATFLTKSTFTILDNDTLDTAAPILISTSPADNATNVAINANIVLTFNEAVTAGTGNITIYGFRGALVATIAITDTSQVTFSGNTVTINPTSNLLANTPYEVRLATAGTIKDLAGNNFAALSNPINFLTGNFTATAAAPASNQIVGTAGDDLLTATDGNDVFVFTDNAGTDTLVGFDHLGEDTIRLSIAGVTDFAAVQAVMTQVGADVLIDFATTDIVLLNTSLASMGLDDFTFV